MNPFSVTEINSLSRDEFVRVLGPVFERSPWIAGATCARSAQPRSGKFKFGHYRRLRWV